MGSLSAQTDPGWATIGGNAGRNGLIEALGPDKPRMLWQGTGVEATAANQVYLSGSEVVTTRRQSNRYAPLVCHDLYTGELLWTKDLADKAGQSIPVGFREGVVYAIRAAQRADTLYALAAADGSVLWQAEAAVKCAHTASINFAPDGDLIVESAAGELMRVDHRSGRTVWRTKCQPIAAGEMHPTVGNGHVYAWEWQRYPNQAVSAFDLTSGERVATRVIPNEGKQVGFVQTPITVGPGGTVYAYKPHDHLVALHHEGSELRTRWKTPVTGSAAFSQLACTPEGDVYLPDGGRIVRVATRTGQRVDSTEKLVRNADAMSVRMAVDAMGHVFASVGEFPTGTLRAFGPDLKQLWQHPIEGLHLSGPALNENGMLVVAGSGRQLLTFQPAQYVATGGMVPAERRYNVNVTPDPDQAAPKVQYSLQASENVRIRVSDLTGRSLRTWEFENQPAGAYEILLKELDERNGGMFILTFENEEGEVVRKKVSK
ncbi:MAG: PQQ-binding-like beta-propeller repeat protein [Catalinimonas sp.]